MTEAELLGRRAEIEVLSLIMAEVQDEGVALLLTGEAGIGKSSLLRVTADLARRGGHQVLEATGVEAEEQMPFAGLQQLLAPVLSAAGSLPTIQRRALLKALGLEEGPPPQLFLVGLAALTLLSESAADRPVVVVLDDVQWLDGLTHEVLAFVARRIASDPVVIIGAVRAGHDGPLLRAGLRQMEVHPLDEGSARGLLRSAARDLDPTDQERIIQQAQGNPLALVELPSAWRSAGSAAARLAPDLLPLSVRLERTFAARLDELPQPTRDALLIGAIDAEDDLPETLAAASVLNGSDVNANVLDAAAELGLVAFDHTRLRFRHPLVKSGILQSESTRRRQAANAALADVLHHQPFRRAWYRGQATFGPDDEVADDLEANHPEAIRHGSILGAIDALERSAQLTTDSARRGRRLLLAAELAHGLGRAELVDRLLNAAASNALSDLDQARMVWLAELSDNSSFGEPRRVLEMCDIAERAFSAADADLAHNMLLAAALRCWWADPGLEARARVVAVTEARTSVGRDPRYVATLAVAQPVLRGRTVERLLTRIRWMR